MLVNLIDNALKFNRDGGSVRVSSESLGAEVAVTVRDTGSGIPPEHLPHIFEPYWRGRDDRRGLGLGLCIAKGLVEKHGGRIHVESERGRGTHVTFVLPRLMTGPSEV